MPTSVVSKLLSKDPIPEEVKLGLVGSFPVDAPWPQGTCYTDGSGGDFSSLPLLRRAGVGVVRLDSAGDFLFGAYCPVPGSCQTVPYSELYAVFVVVSCVQFQAKVEVVSDSEIVVRGLLTGTKSGPMAELWQLVHACIASKELVVTPRWAKSHTPLSAGSFWISIPRRQLTLLEMHARMPWLTERPRLQK